MKKLMMILSIVAIMIFASSNKQNINVVAKESIPKITVPYAENNSAIGCWSWMCYCTNENCGECGGVPCRYTKFIGGCYEYDPFNYVEYCQHDSKPMSKRKVRCPVPNGCN